MPPVVIAAGIATVGAVGSSLIGAAAAKKAGRVRAEAAERTAELQAQQFQETRADLAPWRTIGAQALGQYADMLGVPRTAGAEVAAAPDRSAFFESPGYQFRLGEGIRAVERSAAARGSLQSGAAMKAVQRYGEGLAGQEYGNYMAQLGGLAGAGQQAVTQTGVFGAQAAGARGAAGERAGAARASGYLGAAGQYQQGIADVAGFGGYLFGGGATPNFNPGFNQPNQGFPAQIPNYNFNLGGG
jgi:hypothetical protein